MTAYVSKATILLREDPRVTIDDFEANRLASFEREESAINAAADAVKKVWQAASEVAMLALASAKVGHEAKRTDTKSIYTLASLPATNLANWELTGRYDILVSIESISGLEAALDDKLDADATAVDSDKLGGKALGQVEDERNNAITTAINALIAGAPGTYDTLQEIAAYIADDETGAAALTLAIADKVAIVDIVNDLTTNDPTKPLSAAQGLQIVSLIGGKQDEIAAATGWAGGSDPLKENITATDYAEGGTKTVQDLAKILTALILDLKTQGLLAT